MSTEVIDYANDDTPYNLLENETSIIIETVYTDSNGEIDDSIVELPEKYGRIVAFQSNNPSSARDRLPYMRSNFEIVESSIFAQEDCKE